MMVRHYSPEDNVLVGLVQEDPRYLSEDPHLQRALLKELLDGGFSEDFIAERLPKLRPYLRVEKKPQRRASANKAL
jgi:hypothetical protein